MLERLNQMEEIILVEPAGMQQRHAKKGKHRPDVDSPETGQIRDVHQKGGGGGGAETATPAAVCLFLPETPKSQMEGF